MKSTAPRFGFTLVAVALAHVLVVGFLLLTGFKGCVRPKPETRIPIEFIVAMDDAPPVPPPPPPPPPPPDIKPDDIVLEDKKPPPPKPPDKKPDPPKPPDKKPDPPKPPDRKPDPPKPFEKGRRIEAAKPPTPPPKTPRLSPEEIKRLLALGATPGDRNEMPTGDALYFELIRRQLHRAWSQPAAAPAHLKAEVEITFNAAGDILYRRLIKPSGHAEMDRSVMNAVQAVPRIEGLSPEFLNRRRIVTITFELTAGRG